MSLMLDYNDAAHEYRLGGIIIPSVTQALKLAGLIDTRYYTAEAAARGSAVHAATALCDGSQDQSLASVIGRCDQNIENYVEAYWAFLFDTGIVYSDIERRRAHDELRYAGDADTSGHMADKATSGIGIVTMGARSPFERRVTSSNIKALRWTPNVSAAAVPISGASLGQCDVEFLNGGVYAHDDVPYSVFDGVSSASSVGAAYNRAMKGSYATRKIVADAKDRPVVVDEQAAVTKDQFDYLIGRAVRK